MITQKTLTKCRKEALQLLNDHMRCASLGARPVEELNQRILRLTQELLDAHLIRKVDK